MNCLHGGCVGWGTLPDSACVFRVCVVNHGLFLWRHREGACCNAVQVQAFRDVLRADHDIPCTIRQEKGQDIAGACGQLVIDHKSGATKGLEDIEEVAARLMAVR